MNKFYAIFLSGLICLNGCVQHDYKAEADETVYNIIDQKWKDDFGSKVNFKISDTTPSPNDIKVKKVVPVSGILTLAQAVAMATAHSRQYQLEKELLYTTALDLRLARHVFEPQPFGVIGGQYEKQGEDENIGAFGSAGFEQMLTSGTVFTSSVTAAWVEVLSGNSQSGLRTLINATITQPLLRGSNSEIVMEKLTQAERDTLYQIRSFNRFRKSFVVSIISQYYRLVQLYDGMKNAEMNCTILSQVYARAEKLSNAGRLPRFELDQANQDILEAQDDYSQAQRDYQQTLDDFKLFLSLPATADIKVDENELKNLRLYKSELPDAKTDRQDDDELLELIQPDALKSERERYDENYYKQLQAALSTKDSNDCEWIGKDEAVFSNEDITKTVLTLRLDLANIKDQIDDAKRKVNVASDNLRAGLNLVAGSDIVSGENAELSLFDSFGLGLALDLPLDRMAEANEYRKSMINLTQRQRDCQEAFDSVVLEVRRAYRKFVEASRRFKIQSESLDLARQRFKNTFLLLEHKRADIRDVLDAQEDLLDAQNAVTDTMVDHAIATLEFYRDMGVLQVRSDGMWDIQQPKD